LFGVLSGSMLFAHTCIYGTLFAIGRIRVKLFVIARTKEPRIDLFGV